MNFETYLNHLPLLHSWDRGKTGNTGGFNAAQLKAFHRLAGGERGGASILETGAGNSTLTFLFARPERLVSIAPDEQLFERIRSWTDENVLDRGPLRVVVERSEVVLPGIALEELTAGRRCDLALLDGGHGWPTVFVDFCYANALLQRGGLLLLDDVQLHSVKELARLLAKQPEFKLVEDLGKVLAFEKQTDDLLMMDFGTQPYITERTMAGSSRRTGSGETTSGTPPGEPGGDGLKVSRPAATAPTSRT